MLAPGGRLLNHAISTPDGARSTGAAFTARYVFPDGELEDVADVVSAMEAVDLEVRDVESLREHYPLTLRRWVDQPRRRAGTRRSPSSGRSGPGSGGCTWRPRSVGFEMNQTADPPGAGGQDQGRRTERDARYPGRDGLAVLGGTPIRSQHRDLPIVVTSRSYMTD